ncbi:MAG: endolytic transglycosylase MltG [Candidatus Sericytochromatia bacterium]|nr:endolytic transglycosylase MltG [Candidatus Tanganyikabacteria bacterium]
MKRDLPFILAAFLAAFFLATGGFMLAADMLSAPDPSDGRPQAFEVARGESFRQVAAKLEAEGFIRNAAAFRLLGEVRGAGRKIKAGFYSLSRTLAAADVLTVLTASGGDQVRVTIPEGWELRQIAAGLARKGVAGADEFLAAATDPAPYQSRFAWLALLPAGATLEGFLFPDTYMVAAGMPVRSLIEMMLARFEQVAWAEIKDRAEPLPPFESVVLASIVEREAARAQERPLIAGIYLNRLRLGMKLGADPTVEYALGRRQDAEHNLTYADIAIESPYNTYKHKGLPPGPIANPGLASLRAVLRPERTEYLYFVARGDGSHEFSRSYREQIAAQRRFQRHR